jgi:hypothetical protein
MLRSIEGSRGKSFAHNPALRGFQVLYHPGEVNRCPACGRTHWYVGRLSAECGFCGTAIALADTGMTGSGLFFHGIPREFDEAA